MSEKDDGGPAFPGPLTHTPTGDEIPGMTLRDYFAAKALTPLVDHSAYEREREIARRAYEIADAMLEARKS